MNLIRFMDIYGQYCHSCAGFNGSCTCQPAIPKSNAILFLLGQNRPFSDFSSFIYQYRIEKKFYKIIFLHRFICFLT